MRRKPSGPGRPAVARGRAWPLPGVLLLMMMAGGSGFAAAQSNTSVFVPLETEGLSCDDSREQLANRVLQCKQDITPLTVAPMPCSFSTGTSSLTAAAAGNTTAVAGLLRDCFTQAGQDFKTLLAFVPIDGKPFLDPLLTTFSKNWGIQVSTVWTTLERMAIELLFAVESGTAGIFNIFLFNTETALEQYDAGLFRDLTEFINHKDQTGQAFGAVWQEIHPFFRQQLAIINGQIISIPFVSAVPYMYFRRDVFARFNLTVPQTWDEVVEVATFLSKVDWDPRVRRKIPICFPKPLISDMGNTTITPSGYLLPSILGSMTMYEGVSQGLLYDPATMEPLVNTPAMARALSIYARLAALMPDQTPDNKPFTLDQPIFTQGFCALGFRWAEQFKWSPTFGALTRGNMGMSIMPGSTSVWDRAAGQMVPCTAVLCPNADAITRPDPQGGSGNATLWVNRVAYSGQASFGPSVNAYSDAGYHEVAYQLCTFVGGQLLNSNQFSYLPLVPFGPIKSNQLEVSPAAIALWPPNYNRNDVVSFLTATQQIINHPNTLLDLKMPLQMTIKRILDDACRLVERDGVTTLPAIMNSTAAQLSAVVNTYHGGRAVFQQLYTQRIGYVPPPPLPPPPARSGALAPPPPGAGGGGGDAMSGELLGLIIGVSVGGFVLVAGAAAVVFARNAQRAKQLGPAGKSAPPGLGPLTTLVVTDVQASTSLWDTLLPEVMDRSVALHFTILRQLAAHHGGYESATEGDSIILGFHDAMTALKCTMEAQAALVLADWPEALLEHPLCAPQYATGAGKTELPPCPTVWKGAATALAEQPSQDVDANANANRSGLLPPGSRSTLWARLSMANASNSAAQSSPGALAAPGSPSGKGARPAPPGGMGSLASARSFALSRHWMGYAAGTPRAHTAHGGAPMGGDVAVNGEVDGVARAGDDVRPPPGAWRTVRQWMESMIDLGPSLPPESQASSVGRAAANSQRLVFCGLRVRMGIHTGLEDPTSVVVNHRTGLPQYAGKPLAVTTAVCASGQGGMVLFSDATMSQLDTAVLPAQGTLIASMGSVMLMDMDAPVQLYQAWPQHLAYRACTLTQLRYTQQLTPAYLDAPTHHVTVCFMHVVGLVALNAWSAGITQASLKIYQDLASVELEKFEGYLVNSSNGLVVTAFEDPARAIRWALSTMAVCLDAEWDPELLEHELGEEVVVGNNRITELTPAEAFAEGSEILRLSHQRGAAASTANSPMPAPARQAPTVPQPATLAGQPSLSRGPAAFTTPERDTQSRFSVARASDALRPNGIMDTTPHSSSHASGGSRRPGVVKTITQKTVLFRGLRLKCAVDAGYVSTSLEPSTGRVTYFGKVMNRAARIGGMTKTGQVWCSQHVWTMAVPTINSAELCSLDVVGGLRDRGSTKTSDAGGAAMARTTPFPAQPNGLPRLASKNVKRSSSVSCLAPTPSLPPLPAGASTSTHGALLPQPSQQHNSALPTTPPHPSVRRLAPSSDGQAPAAHASLPPARTHDGGRGLGDASPLALRRRSHRASQPGQLAHTAAASFSPTVSRSSARKDYVKSASGSLVDHAAPHLRTSAGGHAGASAASPAAAAAWRKSSSFARRSKRNSHSGVSAAMVLPSMVGGGVVRKSESGAMLQGLMHDLASEHDGEHARPTSTDVSSTMRFSAMAATGALLVAGVPLGMCRLRGIQESVELVHCRFDEQNVVAIGAAPRRTSRLAGAPALESCFENRSSSATHGTPLAMLQNSSSFTSSLAVPVVQDSRRGSRAVVFSQEVHHQHTPLPTATLSGNRFRQLADNLSQLADVSITQPTQSTTQTTTRSTIPVTVSEWQQGLGSEADRPSRKRTSAGQQRAPATDAAAVGAPLVLQPGAPTPASLHVFHGGLWRPGSNGGAQPGPAYGSPSAAERPPTLDAGSGVAPAPPGAERGSHASLTAPQQERSTPQQRHLAISVHDAATAAPQHPRSPRHTGSPLAPTGGGAAANGHAGGASSPRRHRRGSVDSLLPRPSFAAGSDILTSAHDSMHEGPQRTSRSGQGHALATRSSAGTGLTSPALSQQGGQQHMGGRLPSRFSVPHAVMPGGHVYGDLALEYYGVEGSPASPGAPQHQRTSAHRASRHTFVDNPVHAFIP